MRRLHRQAATQMTLPFPRDAAAFVEEIREAVGMELSLVLTDNAVTMISVRRAGKKVSVRMHHMFLAACPAVMSEVADFIRETRVKTPLMRDFIKKHEGLVKKQQQRRVSCATAGRCHDLLPVFDAINQEYFSGGISAGITWGRSCGGRVRKRTLGSYSCRTNTIRINPFLDRKRIPGYYVAYVVYHEMLHADMGVEERNGRRSAHSREFRRRERLFRHYEKAMAWEKAGGC